ncbi:HAD hydrolase-like protein [Verrucomicrobia bacterium]|nr:HAD hydrolase-like protein [Verrucomicrobiota bacterium]
MIRLILFDIDGTLIATGGAGVKAFDKAFELLHGVPGAAENLDFAGRTDSAIIRELFNGAGATHSKDAEEDFYACYLHLLDEYLTQNKGVTLPGAHRLLEEINSHPERPIMGLLTGNVVLGAELKLRHHSLWGRFEMGAFGCEHPDRNQLATNGKARAEQILGQHLQGDEILIIGDTHRDIGCARSIGAKVLAVATGDADLVSLEAQCPDIALPDLDSISAAELLQI